jgi:hypothetical protein
MALKAERSVSSPDGYFTWLLFPPSLHYELPTLIIRANNILVDAQFSIQNHFVQVETLM